MSVCKNCGQALDDGVKFCVSCGAAQPIAENNTTGAQGGSGSGTDDFFKKVESKFNEYNKTDDATPEYDKSDIDQNKVMAVLAYLGILLLVPLLAAQKSRFARFHTNQGLILAIAAILYGIAEGIISSILGWIPVLGGIINTVLGLAWIIYAVFAIIGIINALDGKAKELPVIGKYRILK